MTEERHPWDRLPGETSVAYDAFRVYRDRGPGRRVELPGYSSRSCRKWAHLWSWSARAVAWDDEIARLEDVDRLESLRTMHSNHAKAARAVQAYALQALSRLDIDSATPADVARLLELGARLERVTLSESVEELQGKTPFAAIDDPWTRIASELTDSPAP